MENISDFDCTLHDMRRCEKSTGKDVKIVSDYAGEHPNLFFTIQLIHWTDFCPCAVLCPPTLCDGHSVDNMKYMNMSRVKTVLESTSIAG